MRPPNSVCSQWRRSARAMRARLGVSLAVGLVAGGCRAGSCDGGSGTQDPGRGGATPAAAVAREGGPGAAPPDAAPPRTEASGEPAGAGDAEPVADGAADLPLLVAPLGAGRVAVLLDPEAPPKTDGGAATLLARSPIATAAVDLPAHSMSRRARAARAETYRVGDLRDARCTGRLVRVVDVARIPIDDPTMADVAGPAGGAAPPPDKEIAARVFGAGDHATAAIVELSGPCGSPAWAVPEGSPLPATLPTARADAAATAKIRGALATTNETYRALPSGPDWKERFAVTALGADRAWVVAVRWQPGSPHRLCALVDRSTSPPKVLAETTSCPETLEGALRYEGNVVLSFAHAIARAEGRELRITYFPTATTSTYGAP